MANDMPSGVSANVPGVLRQAVCELTDDIVAVRRELHRHAELSTEEWHTQEVILEWLRRIGADDVRAVADTGATGILGGARPGPNILWRADMDGLPLEEETGLAFASQNPHVMHACGHDGHVAIALGIATALAKRRDALAGSVRFAFQPAEERIGGARRMIDAGIMDDPRVDRVFGLHIWANTPVGSAAVVAGPIFSAATHFRIIVRGRGGHASAPHQAVDPIVVAAHVVVALQTVVSRAVTPDATAVLTVGRIQGGVRGNVIPSEVMLSGTIRAFDAEVTGRMLERTDEIVRGVTDAFGAGYQFDYSTLPAVVNDAQCADVVRQAAAGALGVENVGDLTTTGADDMAYFLEAAPGAYFFLGGGNTAKGMVHPHHSPKFDFDEACLPLGVEIGLRIIEGASGSRLTSRAGKPILIADYDPAWQARFEAERGLILSVAGNALVAIEHVGSTAVAGLAAKPIIDIMPGLRSLDDAPAVIAALASIGYEYVPEFEHDSALGPGLPDRRYFRKDIDGERAFHLHMVEKGSEFWTRHLMFRNYLRVVPREAKAYAELKRQLAGEYNAHLTSDSNINVGYTDRKTDFVEATLAKARAVVESNAPIAIVEPDPQWVPKFARERDAIARIAGDVAASIEHVGSTAVAGLPAKPVVDIAMGVSRMDEGRTLIEALRAIGYIKHDDEDDACDWNVYEKHGDGGACHLHMVPFEGDRWQRYLLFRDYLRSHPDEASAYAEMKRELAAEYGRDLLGYTEAKSDFVNAVLRRARTGARAH